MPQRTQQNKKLQMYQKKMWEVYSLPIESEKSSFKIHVDIGSTLLSSKLKEIKPLLEIAICNNIIRKFKVWSADIPLTKHYIHKLEFRLSCLKHLQDYLNNKVVYLSDEAHNIFRKYLPAIKKIDAQSVGDQKIIEKVEQAVDRLDKKIRSFYRLINHSITIYLPKEGDYKGIADLCFQLEEILQSSRTHEDVLSRADLPLLPHLSGRQEILNNKYIAIGRASEIELAALEEQGKISEAYMRLKLEIEKKQKAVNLISDQKSKTRKL